MAEHDTIVRQETRRVIEVDGARITVSDSKFEIYLSEENEIFVQFAIQHLKQWCKWRKNNNRQREEWKIPR